jgi:hypothetical protein
LDAELLGGVRDRLRASYGAGRAVERCHEAVSGGVDLSTSETPQFVAHRAVVRVEERMPPLIAQRGGTGRGCDDVGEDHGGENAIDLDDGSLTGQELGDLVCDYVQLRGCGGVPARELDEGRAFDVVSEVAPVGDRDERVVFT